MKNIKDTLTKLDKRVLYGVIIGILLIIILFLLLTPSTLELTKEETLIDGFTSKETLVIKIKNSKIKSIKLSRDIKLSDYYSSIDTYTNSLEKVLNNGYSYLGDSYNLKKDNNKIKVDINTKEKGVVLNNLTIKYNGEDDTTLRYDIETDLKSESSINVGEKVSKKQLKKKLKKYGYK